MQFTYSDIHRYNFLFTNKDEGYIYIIDFGHASFLPSSFMSYALWDCRYSLTMDIADRFYPGRTNELYSKNDNVKTLHCLRTFWVIGNAHTGKWRPSVASVSSRKNGTNYKLPRTPSIV
jgi:hypothetical protein